MVEKVIFIAIYIPLACLWLCLRNLIFRGNRRREKPLQRIVSEIEARRIHRKVEWHNRHPLRLALIVLVLFCATSLIVRTESRDSDRAQRIQTLGISKLQYVSRLIGQNSTNKVDRIWVHSLPSSETLDSAKCERNYSTII